jgi:hypothetical protein
MKKLFLLAIWLVLVKIQVQAEEVDTGSVIFFMKK